MAGTIFRLGSIQVFIGAEDHPPPHVHAYHAGQGWRARFRFSFLSDVTALYRFRRRGRRPTDGLLNQVAEAVILNLPACRAEWWHTHGERHEIGLVNRMLEIRPAGEGLEFRVRVVGRPGPDSVRIVQARYDPVEDKVVLQLAGGKVLRLTPGAHIEEADEW